MSILKKDGQILDNAEAIENHVLHYFSSLYASENICVDNDLVDNLIPSMVSNEDNAMLTNLHTLEEVKNVD